MIKKTIIKISAAAAMICGMCTAGMNAGAATIEEVAETARRLGFPESVVQQGMNEYYADPDLYTPDVLDDAIDYLYSYEAEIKAQLGITGSPANPETTTQEQKVTEPTSSGQTETPSQNTSQTQGNTGITAPTEQNSSNTAGVPNEPDEKEFINMTLDEKREYISTLTPEEQQKFFNTLTAEELKSIVKQLPTDDKAEVIDTFVKAGDAMGIKITVEEISDENISMSMRNNNGELIDVASVGMIIEDTGYDYSNLFALSGAFILAAACGLWLVLRKCFRREETGAEK
ncbi:MAG: hypothetical protein IJX77_05000 [Ruminococcus sp.]|nr:hypothetical protein [Ruminococcus sp.]MBQ8297122.1 hypothetical protein [Ruminococcus sp.]